MSGEAGTAGPRQRRRVIVLRHGQTDHNAGGIWQGQLDSDLSEVGHLTRRRRANCIA